MAKRIEYTVRYGNEIAKFSNRHDAFVFARKISVPIPLIRQSSSSEISDKSGLIGQFEDGEATPEFSHLDR